MARTKSADNWEQYSLKQMEALAAADLAAQAPALGLTADEQGRVKVTFLARDYLVSREGLTADIVAVDGGPVTANHKSVLAHYLMSRGRGQLTGEYLPIGRLTGIAATGGSPSDNLIRPLTEKFGDKYEAFEEAARKIGGVSQGRAPSGGRAWLFQALPFLPVQVVFFEADEEFEAEVKVLFDSSAPVFVAYEVLELMEMVLVAELLLAAGLLGCGHQH
ncbi:MAG: DUF3786 domain-containing protein [Candidatus Adiutrix sp.]|jgi:hypothetical protein|nr:DUF3786 domain-containing protein [Candidatus Adiutrix sp.]